MKTQGEGGTQKTNNPLVIQTETPMRPPSFWSQKGVASKGKGDGLGRSCGQTGAPSNQTKTPTNTRNVVKTGAWGSPRRWVYWGGYAIEQSSSAGRTGEDGQTRPGRSREVPSGEKSKKHTPWKERNKESLIRRGPTAGYCVEDAVRGPLKG